ncbi:Acyl-CoA-binding domain-containing protein 5 [Apodemus speciosus]|uniref:Acyl-CoA-binding domain-containing protein 5 n=1 Tax=Apodemus speciosus TaxID=105296 RepID=A0ABQ0EGC9_APOSI
MFHAGSWESWCCCCCVIPADRPWDRGPRWQLEMADTRSVYETRFEAAVKVIQSLPKNGSFQPTNEMMLKFYSFYKQATEGPCKLSRPGFWDPIGRYKWDAWSSLGDMTKEEAMIAYVEEMKKIIETMPMTEKVEELLHVIGPFYEIVEDKKSSKSSDLTSEDGSNLGNVLTSSNAKAVNGKAESSDSGAESEEEEAQEELKGAEQSDTDGAYGHQTAAFRGQTSSSIIWDLGIELRKPSDFTAGKKMMKKSTDKNLEIIVTNGYKDSFAQDICQSDSQTDSSPRVPEAVKMTSLEIRARSGQETLLSGFTKYKNEDPSEDASGIHHLTSDSDSEVYCDSMEQFGQEECGGLPQHLQSSGFCEDAHQSPGSGSTGDMQMVAVKGSGGVKHGGEDGRSGSGAPPREKRGGESEDFSSVRRGRGHRMPHLSEGTKGRQIGSGGDGERWGSDRGPRGSLNEQIALVLLRLQEDMQNVLQRLHKLETLTASQRQPYSQRPSWWPFEMSPGALAFAVVWPFIAQWLVHLYYQRRRRKLN